jgi:hypothetical protein
MHEHHTVFSLVLGHNTFLYFFQYFFFFFFTITIITARTCGPGPTALVMCQTQPPLPRVNPIYTGSQDQIASAINSAIRCPLEKEDVLTRSRDRLVKAIVPV